MKNTDGSWEVFEDYVLDFAIDQMRADKKTALVTLAKIEGASPRPLGAQMAVSESGEWVGYLSGGCIERAVVAEALEAIKKGKNRVVRYGRGSKYLDIQLPCGSAIELVFDVTKGVGELSSIDGLLQNRSPASMKLTIPDSDKGRIHVEQRHYQPRRRLLVAGVGPSAVQLARLGRTSGFDALLYSPDSPTISAVEAHGIGTVRVISPAMIPDIQADSRTAVVCMFHDHHWEMGFLPAALRTDAFYVGAMGSRATHRNRLAELRELQIEECQLKRIHGPAGLFSSGKSASDISISILAEIAKIEQAQRQSILLNNNDDQFYRSPSIEFERSAR